jgi:hypothetical protein
MSEKAHMTNPKKVIEKLLAEEEPVLLPKP